MLMIVFRRLLASCARILTIVSSRSMRVFGRSVAANRGRMTNHTYPPSRPKTQYARLKIFGLFNVPVSDGPYRYS